MNPAVVEFIQKHATKSAAEVALLLSKNQTLPKEFILHQINGRQKAKQKFSFLLGFPNFIFPSARAVSQSSSEKTARYKASIVKANSIVDLSGGMGIDAYFFSKHANHVDYVELNSELASITEKNFKLLGADHICVHQKDSAQFLLGTEQHFDLIYIDPDRRVKKERAFRIDECEPKVGTLLPQIWSKSKQCLIKLSPMLDISQALEELTNCKEVHIVSVDNECKELLFLLEKDFSDEPTVQCVNIKKECIQHFSFSMSEERSAMPQFSRPLNFLYEPNASILKAGGFKRVATFFGLSKLETNTHLYSSDELIENFPGRTIRIQSISKPKKGMVEKANVVCRNFPQNPEDVKKKYKVKDGGELFLYATTLANREKAFIVGELI